VQILGCSELTALPPAEGRSKRKVAFRTVAGRVRVDLTLDYPTIIENHSTLNLIVTSSPKHCPPHRNVRHGWRSLTVMNCGTRTGEP